MGSERSSRKVPKKRVEITIPYPPSVNTYWRMARGRMIISKRGREYRDAVDVAVKNHFDSEEVEDPRPLLGRLKVKIKAIMPDRRRRDIDNIAKATLDALGYAGIYGDDEQIDDLRIVRGEVLKPGCLDIEITEKKEV